MQREIPPREVRKNSRRRDALGWLEHSAPELLAELSPCAMALLARIPESGAGEATPEMLAGSGGTMLLVNGERMGSPLDHFKIKTPTKKRSKLRNDGWPELKLFGASGAWAIWPLECAPAELHLRAMAKEPGVDAWQVPPIEAIAMAARAQRMHALDPEIRKVDRWLSLLEGQPAGEKVSPERAREAAERLEDPALIVMWEALGCPKVKGRKPKEQLAAKYKSLLLELNNAEDDYDMVIKMMAAGITEVIEHVPDPWERARQICPDPTLGKQRALQLCQEAADRPGIAAEAGRCRVVGIPISPGNEVMLIGRCGDRHDTTWWRS